MKLLRALGATLLALLVLFAGTPLARADSDTQVRAKIARAIADARVRSGTNGTVILDAFTGRTVFARGAETAVAPASNLKLLTALTALRDLGPDHRIPTRAIASVRPRSGVLKGDLWLKGYGDPSLRVTDLRALARQVRAAGIRQVTGRLLADTTFFTDPAYAKGWATRDGARAWAPQIRALTLSPDTKLSVGTIAFTVRPTAAGRRAKVSVSPAVATRYLHPSVFVMTRGRTSLQTYHVKGTNRISVVGSIAAGATPVTVLVSVHRPELLAAAVFRAELKAAGVKVAGPTASGPAPAKRPVVLTHLSRPLSGLPAPLLKVSNTGLAEHLVRLAGAAPGRAATVANGLRRVTALLRYLKVPTGRIVLHDGSGLSRGTKVTARAVARALLWALHQPWGVTFRKALPVAGRKGDLVGGTLANRMRGTAAAGRVWAKTGTLPNVTALSGYAASKSGRIYVFSMISNYRGGTPRPVENRLAVLLARG